MKEKKSKTTVNQLVNHKVSGNSILKIDRRRALKYMAFLPAFAYGCTSGSKSGTNKGEEKELADGASASGNSIVYMTKAITPAGLMAVYEKLGRPASGKTAIKLHMGEPGNTNFLSPDLVRDLVLAVNGTLVDSNTYYGGRRTTNEDHLESAREHGFTFAPIDILDAEGEVRVPVHGGNRLKEAIIGSHYRNYDFIISVAHFKGHEMAGFGGSFKNMAVGMASVKGKEAIHGEPGNPWGSTTEAFLEKVAEYNKAMIDEMGDKIIYINILNKLSVDCDCNANAEPPQMDDIGILASLDPVALDRASVDMVYAAPKNEHLVERIESRNGTHLINYAEKIGLGSQQYKLIEV
ncbi:putative Fe-S center protein [Parabacteroides sp. PF5-5]|uniref:DUF362 domain-containing protein n=1 Tax=unclassified Parabacteroides TaxID=2649774 RepID=UPI0024758452|nr:MULTISPECIES: DUF362 domain-containing protein [unclassified Parabacteroides]MDH6303884.1 putative Fe-S center protein [Parabacteroides sp. PH5-39]MDH6314501.1 putative Fe-S center protein [Parabacteroides sp. PF5-13]MDH6318434.1 putative Fe-S center protein [Parabacteroides sp. PH5-13]MDH6322273.1 putative Fe-S center protein [Parabacteroides sp. PH5-8]MDH6325647.1 putative Fe-S center protein [Parabacteroides sp. PH5-41]